jgi:hypothetical protein
MTKQERCIEYLSRSGYEAYEYCGNVHIYVDAHLDIQLSDSEVSYRAELHQESEELKFQEI